ncbi:hypothetical protein HZY62_02075 [Maribacter polysiphoniae]|uniref:Uncharacterized protein n=1 Tax=Maribacter polysiphoniae TaxID=429344 RepID=A0A316E5X4_9FLAO|nr:hypothetical protein [Maribacter polysiphoniae]MBD1259360.1 hypothetical protein [Maribacter polysiphoniae]PWK24922.1 hypothetical protein LX92_01290 [Maribacter polysiphoniae]
MPIVVMKEEITVGHKLRTDYLLLLKFLESIKNRKLNNLIMERLSWITTKDWAINGFYENQTFKSN